MIYIQTYNVKLTSSIFHDICIHVCKYLRTLRVQIVILFVAHKCCVYERCKAVHSALLFGRATLRVFWQWWRQSIAADAMGACDWMNARLTINYLSNLNTPIVKYTFDFTQLSNNNITNICRILQLKCLYSFKNNKP